MEGGLLQESRLIVSQPKNHSSKRFLCSANRLGCNFQAEGRGAMARWNEVRLREEPSDELLSAGAALVLNSSLNLPSRNSLRSSQHQDSCIFVETGGGGNERKWEGEGWTGATANATNDKLAPIFFKINPQHDALLIQGRMTWAGVDHHSDNIKAIPNPKRHASNNDPESSHKRVKVHE